MTLVDNAPPPIVAVFPSSAISIVWSWFIQISIPPCILPTVLMAPWPPFRARNGMSESAANLTCARVSHLPREIKQKLEPHTVSATSLSVPGTTTTLIVGISYEDHRDVAKSKAAVSFG